MIDRNDKKEIYLQFYTHLKGMITSGEIMIDSKFPSVRNLMREYKLSSATVTRAINMLCDDNLLKSIPKRGYYVLDQDFNSFKLQTDLKHIVAFVTEKNIDANSISDDPIFTNLLRCIEQELAILNYDVLPVFLNSLNTQDLKRFERVLEKVDGIFLSYDVNNKYLRLANNLGIPVVGIHATFKDTTVFNNKDNITIDRKDAFFKAASYLLDLGHRKIYYVDGWQMGGFKERYSGISSAFKEASLPIPNNNVLITNGWSSEHGRLAVKDVSIEHLPTAFICSNDVLATGLIKGLSEKGLSVPQDISVVGAKNTYLAELSNPSITSIDYRDNDIAKKAVNTIINRINGDLSPPCTSSFYPDLVIRSSCKKY
jgi:LacI family transcriptional regulator